MVKQAVHVSVIGRAKTGKTTVLKLLAQTLKNSGVEVEINWGVDGEPLQTPPELEKKRLAGISAKSKVVISEVNTRRTKSGNEEQTDVIIEVKYDEEKGYGVRLVIASFPLESWFGKFSASKDRARTVASRLSAEFDIDYYDDIPRDYEWSQPR